MKPRITLCLTKEGAVEILLNESGRDRLIEELRGLSLASDHFHLDVGEHSEVVLQKIAYDDRQKVIEHAKVLFRPDEWDRRYFPHVLGSPGDTH